MSDELKFCPHCNQLSSPRSGNRRICVPCSSRKRLEWYHRNRESQKAVKAQQYQRARARDPSGVRERSRKWVSENRDKHAAYVRNWKENNRDAYRTYLATYQASKRAKRHLATPSWANQLFIREIYELARLRTKMTGIEWHVDHVIPLNGETVCGLHVETNLQVIPGKLNQLKRNRWEAQNR